MLLASAAMRLDARGSPAPACTARSGTRVIRSTKPFRRLSGAYARRRILPPALFTIASFPRAPQAAYASPRRSSASETSDTLHPAPPRYRYPRRGLYPALMTIRSANCSAERRRAITSSICSLSA
ncbi:hypothetical protein KCP76_03525 [Salmonella enterica subsp. enterica serovar Weltevreden]|nr:hypothetical protein KCP76_03525 [Salmonella enterica subsp. enterica serovar Weltevreden]